MTFLAILFTLATMLWMVPVVRSGRMLLLAMIVLLLGTVAGPSLFAIDGPIQLSVDRMLFFGVMGLAVVGLRLGITKLPRLNRIDLLLAAMVGWFLISVLTGGEAPSGIPPMARWIFHIAIPACMYAIARLVKVRVEDIRWMVFGIIGLGVYLSVTAVFEVKGLHALVYPKYIVDATTWEFFGRGRGPLMNPVANGIVISFAMVAAALKWMGASRDKQLLYGAVFLSLLAGLYATLTRSVWLGGVAAVGIIGFFYSPRWIRVFGLAVVVLFGGLAMTGFKDEIMRMKRDKNLSAADAEKSVKLRPLLAIVALEMFKDRPLTGHGYGYYPIKKRPFLQDRSYSMPLEQARPYVQHNVFLSVLVDTGLIGFSLFTGWLISIFAMAWKLARDSSSAREARWVGFMVLGVSLAYAINGLFHDVMIIPMMHMFLFFLAGVSVTIAQRGLTPAMFRPAVLSPAGSQKRRSAEDPPSGNVVF